MSLPCFSRSVASWSRRVGKGSSDWLTRNSPPNLVPQSQQGNVPSTGSNWQVSLCHSISSLVNLLSEEVFLLLLPYVTVDNWCNIPFDTTLPAFNCLGHTRSSRLQLFDPHTSSRSPLHHVGTNISRRTGHQEAHGHCDHGAWTWGFGCGMGLFGRELA